MPESIYLSSGAISTRDINVLLGHCIEAGIRKVELASGLPCNSEGMKTLHEANETHGFIYLIHNYFPAPREPFALNLAATDIETLERSKVHCRNAINLCQQLNVPFFSVHSGFALPVEANDLGNPEAWIARRRNADIDVESAREVFIATVSEIADYASERGIRLLLENNVVSPKLTADRSVHHGLLLCEGHETSNFLKQLNHPNVGLLIDVGHVKVSSTALGFSPDSFIEVVADYIEAFHLSDNDGLTDSNQMFDHGAWFKPYLREFSDLTYVIEVYRMSVEQTRTQYSVLREMLV